MQIVLHEISKPIFRETKKIENYNSKRRRNEAICMKYQRLLLSEKKNK